MKKFDVNIPTKDDIEDFVQEHDYEATMAGVTVLSVLSFIVGCVCYKKLLSSAIRDGIAEGFKQR